MCTEFAHTHTRTHFKNAALIIFVQCMVIFQKEKYLYLSSRLNIFAKPINRSVNSHIGFTRCKHKLLYLESLTDFRALHFPLALPFQQNLFRFGSGINFMKTRWETWYQVKSILFVQHLLQTELSQGANTETTVAAVEGRMIILNDQNVIGRLIPGLHQQATSAGPGNKTRQTGWNGQLSSWILY